MGDVVAFRRREPLPPQHRAIDDAAWLWTVAAFATAAFVEALVNETLDAWRGDR